jgi:hypothetical protein
MTIWQNADGLSVRFGRDEASLIPGKEIGALDSGRHVIEFVIEYTDAQSATAAILGTDTDGSWAPGGTVGIIVPEGAVIEEIELRAQTAFTSSGTIGSSTLVIGTKKLSDRSTELDHDGITTTSFVMGVLDATAETVVVRPGVTGAGDDYGVAFTEPGVIVVANSAHASHPFTAGKARCRLFYRFQ